MADQGATIASLLSSDSPSPTPKVDMSTVCPADTECAQILLELSKSASPATSPQSNTSSSTLSADECKLFEARDARYVQLSHSRSSLLKKELESPAESVYRREIVKRIKMDHNYHWTGEEKIHAEGLASDPFKSYCESLKHDGTVGTSGRNSSKHGANGSKRSSRDRQEGNTFPKPPLGHINSYTKLRKHRPGNGVKTPTKKHSAEMAHSSQLSAAVSPEVGKFHHKYSSTYKENQEVEPSHISPGQAVGIQEDSKYSNDARFHKFELLLRCLADSDMQEQQNGSASSKADNFATQDCDDASHEFDCLLEEFDFACSHCLKKFNKKRYLTKHMRRMHPGVAFPELLDDSSVSCPNCGHSVSKKNFKRHSTVCNVHITKSKKQLEMDLANCQFCGIRMRRHMLVKHLAREHCVDQGQGQEAFDDDDSDSYSSNSSGDSHSGHGRSRGDSLLCQLCEMPILRSEIRHHFTVKHAMRSSPQKIVSCQLCGQDMPKLQLVHHLSDVHCVGQDEGEEVEKEVVPPEVAPLDNRQSSKCECRHSMLQRFLSEEGKENGHSTEDSVEPCPNCMSPLYRTQQDSTMNRTPESKGACNDIIQEAARLAEITTANEEDEVDPYNNVSGLLNLSPDGSPAHGECSVRCQDGSGQ